MDVTALLTETGEGERSDRQLEQESAGRMLQRAARRKTGVSQLQEHVGATDDSENLWRATRLSEG